MPDMICERLPVTDFALGIALHTIGYPLRLKSWREGIEAGDHEPVSSSARLSGWIDYKVRECAKLLTDRESGRLARTNTHHPLLNALAGIHCLQVLETWLRRPDDPPGAWPLLPPAPSSQQERVDLKGERSLLPLLTTDDLAAAAGLITLGFLPHGTSQLHNAGDGTHAALLLLPASRTQPGLTRQLAEKLTDYHSEHPLAYAVFAAQNWTRFRLKCDPAAAREFTALLKGVGARCAVVSRKLLDSTSRYIEIRMPNGQTRRLKNRFRDQMRHHLRGFAASEIT
jgi:hypothetical protein